MNSLASALSTMKTPIEQKAIQKFPFCLNNKTYFSTECYFQDTIINGISLQIKQAKGISDSQQAVSYLNFSNRLIFYAGVNILSYNMYKRKYQIIQQSQNLVCLKALSLSTPEKEYVVWVEKVQRLRKDMMIDGQKRKNIYQICIYDFTRRQKIHQQKLLTINKQIKPQNIEILAFMHPNKIIGIAIYNPKTNSTEIIYKRILNQQAQFGTESQKSYPFQLKHIKYDLQSNSYFFVRSSDEIWALRNAAQSQEQQQKQSLREKAENNDLVVERIMALNKKKIQQRTIIHFNISQAFLIILTCKSNQQRDLQFYSLFSYGLIFSHTVWKPQQTQKIIKSQKNNLSTYLNPDMSLSENEQQNMSNAPIDIIQFNKSIIIGIRNNSNQISVFSLQQQNLKHIRNTFLNLQNCYKIQRLFINPYSSEVLILSRHYQIQGDIHSTQLPSQQFIIQGSFRKYKKLYLQVSSFFITMQSSIINVQKMSLQKKNYCQILTLPWLSQFLIQTDGSFKNKRWQQKFDLAVRCSAIHPTGQYVALGFNDCFKIYFLTYEGLVHTFVAQNIKQCTSLSYSKSGNDFAVATCYSIYIYDCYSYEKKHQIFLGMSYKIQEISYFEGFQNDKGKQCLRCITTNKRIVIYNADKNYIQQFAFNPKSHIQDGIIEGILDISSIKPKELFYHETTSVFQQQFSIIVKNEQRKNISKQISNNLKSKKFGAILYDQKTKVVIFTFGTKIYFISTQNFQSLGCYDFQQISCIQMCQCLKTIFFGTACGKIIAFPWPNKPINITSKIPTFWAHKSRIKKIRVSSNLFDLISITEQSMYIHSLSLIKQMRKIQKNQLQRQFSPQSMLSTDFYIKAGICLFSADKYEQKCELIKQNQQEAVNFNFILPQERQKQKIVMLRKLEVQKQKITCQTRQLNLPLKLQAVNLKQRVKNVQKQLKINEVLHQNLLQKEIQSYQKRISQLNMQKDELRKSHAQSMRTFQIQRTGFQHQLTNQRVRSEILMNLKLNNANKATDDADKQKQKHLNNFFQLAQIDQQKRILNQATIQQIQNQISNMLQRNGYLMCKNAHLQKQISIKKRKIQDVRQLIINTQQNIKNLPRKNKLLQKSEDIKQQAHINRQFAQAQKRYLRQTKILIQKNKAVSVSIQLYERQRQMLVILQKRLETQQQNINEIVKYIAKQRSQRKKIHNRLSFAKQKVTKFDLQYQKINSKRIRIKNSLKQYLFNLNLYNEGVIDIEKLRQISQIDLREMVKCPQNIQLSIEEKKKRIEKIENNQQKILNLVKNERRIYSNQKKKTCIQNQDLLMNFNFLLHQNKYLNNVVRNSLSQLNDQKQKRRYCIKTISRKQNRKIQTKPTPFQNYISFKTGRRTRTSPCAQYELSR